MAFEVLVLVVAFAEDFEEDLVDFFEEEDLVVVAAGAALEAA